MPLTNPIELPVLSQTVVLTNAQIKALPTTPVEIITAPGAGKLIYPVAAVLVVDTQAEVYDPVSPVAQDALIQFTHDGNGGFLPHVAGDYLQVGAFISNGQSVSMIKVNGGNPTSGGNLVGDLMDVTAFTNKAFRLEAWNADDTDENSVDFTGGAPANTLKVTVIYTVIDV